jgi:hypothetical protein
VQLIAITPELVLKFAGNRDVTALHAVEQVMAVPMKRFERQLPGHLTRPEHDRHAGAAAAGIVKAVQPG